MDKNTITGFVLLALLTVGYVFYSSQQQTKLENGKPVIETTSKESSLDTIQSKVDSSEMKENLLVESLGNYASFAKGESKLIQLETDKAIYSFDTKGGVLKSVELKDYKTFDKKPLVLFKGNENEINFSFVNNDNKVLHTKDLYFTTVTTSSKISGTQTEKIDFVLDFENGSKYIHSYSFVGDQYLLNFDIYTENASGFISPLTSSIDVDWSQEMPSLESNIKEERMYSNLYYRTTENYVEELSSRKEDEQTTEQGVQWVSFKQKFFNNTLISTKVPFQKAAKLKIKPDLENVDFVKDAQADLKLPITKGKDFHHQLQWYFGPNKYSDLKKLKIGLDEIIPLGWAIFGWVNKFLIIPVFNVLGKFISNYGIIILILTVLLKLVLAPLNRKQLLSTSKMQILKPEIEELKKKYPNDKQMVGAKQMELFRSAGVNPMGGCLPMLLQMPILFAMYRFFPNSIELRQEPFLWATDLSHYDSIMHLPFTIPLYGDHVSLFTLLMAITSFGYTRMTMSQQQMSVGNDDMMATQMKIMQYVTPFMFLFMFNSFSAALSYYYFLFNLLSIIQTYVLKKFFINEDALRAEIEFNKKQPKKKSSWQNRMDQMMDQQKAVQEKRKGK
jgi:YidC/Oxa1 family membrane protein insertase